MERYCDTSRRLCSSWIDIEFICSIFLAPGWPISAIYWCPLLCEGDHQGALPSLSTPLHSHLLHTPHFPASELFSPFSMLLPLLPQDTVSPNLPNSALSFAFYSNCHLYPPSFLGQASWAGDPYSLLPVIFLLLLCFPSLYSAGRLSGLSTSSLPENPPSPWLWESHILLTQLPPLRPFFLFAAPEWNSKPI